MEGSPTLVGRTASLLPVKLRPYERDEAEAQSARIKAVFQDKTEKTVMRPSVGPTDSMRKRILMVSLYPDIYRASK
jgi:hypothetical protein